MEQCRGKYVKRGMAKWAAHKRVLDGSNVCCSVVVYSGAQHAVIIEVREGSTRVSGQGCSCRCCIQNKHVHENVHIIVNTHVHTHARVYLHS